jgi:hypothetical protein
MLVDPYQKNFYQVQDGCNVWLRLGLLYLVPSEQFVVVTNQITNINKINDITQAPLLNTKFQWHLGSILEAGYFFDNSLWDVNIKWLYYASHARQYQDTSGIKGGQGCFPIWSLNNDILATDYVTSANMFWRLNVNLLECNFAYHYSYKKLYVFPFVGLCSSWINQRFIAQYFGGVFSNGSSLVDILNNYGPDEVIIRNNFWGIGPQLGFYANILFSDFFGLSFRAADCLEYSLIRVIEDETYLQFSRLYQNKLLHRGKWIVDASISLFGKCFLKKEQVALQGEIGWDFFFFPHQVEWQRDQFHLIADNRNLSLMGVFGSLRLDF